MNKYVSIKNIYSKYMCIYKEYMFLCIYKEYSYMYYEYI